MYSRNRNGQYKNFRSSWDPGYEKAERMKRQLLKQGWYVKRGALTERQAEKAIRSLEREGNQTKTITITGWDGETFQFVAYKPKPGVQVEEVKPPSKPKRRPKKPKGTSVERFQRIMWRKGRQPEEDDNGVLMSPDRTMAVIEANANPTKNENKSFLKVRDRIQANAKTVDTLDYKKLLKAQRQNMEYVEILGTTFSIEMVKNAMRSLGSWRTKNNHEAVLATSGEPVVIRHKDTGDTVLIAPASVSTPGRVIRIGAI